MKLFPNVLFGNNVKYSPLVCVYYFFLSLVCACVCVCVCVCVYFRDQFKMITSIFALGLVSPTPLRPTYPELMKYLYTR